MLNLKKEKTQQILFHFSTLIIMIFKIEEYFLKMYRLPNVEVKIKCIPSEAGVKITRNLIHRSKIGKTK